MDKLTDVLLALIFGYAAFSVGNWIGTQVFAWVMG